jgi:glutamate 5-kinase
MTSHELRKSRLCPAKRVVVKFGTQTLTAPDRKLDVHIIRDIASQIATLINRGIEVTVVSSGAIASGVAELGLKRKPKDVAGQQAVAAVGQRGLMTHYHEAFAAHGLKVGQLLLTRSDFDERTRFLNIRNCVAQLHEMRCVPIANENDTVAVEEIRFGDNDMLAALMCNALGADALIIFTGVAGLLDEKGVKVDCVEDVTAAMGLVRAEKSALGTGGMRSKLEAARIVTDAGQLALIASAKEPRALLRLFDGEPLGTVFVPAERRLDSKERWIGLTARPAGSVTIDDGATTALVERGKSLLAKGVTAATGDFGSGDVVLVQNNSGQEIGRGLCNFSATELRLILGKPSTQFEKLLGRPAYDEVIHRDNFVLTQG